MTTVHAEIEGEKAVLRRREFEQLIRLAKQAGEVDVLLEQSENSRPLWETATSSQRAAAFREWAEMKRPPAPDLPGDAVRRENMYD